MKRLLLILLIIFIFHNGSQGEAASSQLICSVSPQVGFTPLTISIHIHIPPDKANSGLGLAIDSGEYFSLSRYDLDEKSPSTWEFTRKGLPAGDYGIGVVLYRLKGKRDLPGLEEVIAGSCQMPLTVLAPGGLEP